MTQYPVLVYGTLRPGHGNYRSFLEGETVYEQDVRIPGFTMHTNGGFPYLVDGEGEITATLVYINQTNYSKVLRSLDWLEGFQGEGHFANHYDRRLHTFEVEGVKFQAWAYIASSGHVEDVKANLHRIESGDWSEFASVYR